MIVVVILIGLSIGILLILKKKKVYGIIVLIISPIIAATLSYFLYIRILFFLLSGEPPYHEHNARENLQEMGFNLKGTIVIANTDYASSWHDESRYSRLVVDEVDKSMMIQTIKQSVNYNSTEEIEDTIPYYRNTGDFNEYNKDSIYERKFVNKHGRIYNAWIYTASDTICFLLEKP